MRATGVVADLFADGVGFRADWGFSRSVTKFGERLLGRWGDLDWRSVDAMVGAAFVENLSGGAGNEAARPDGARAAGIRLYRGVAVSQRVSDWVSRGGREVAVALRCHVGKRRFRGRRQNLVLLQYRVWRRGRRGGVARLRRARQAERVFSPLHRRVLEVLKGDAQ